MGTAQATLLDRDARGYELLVTLPPGDGRSHHENGAQGRGPRKLEILRAKRPLRDESSLESIPLVGRVLGATMTDVPWLKRQETLILKESTGKMSYLLMVKDARTELTSDGRKAVRTKLSLT